MKRYGIWIAAAIVALIIIAVFCIKAFAAEESCTQYFPAGTKITLTAKACPGSYFAGWQGDCTGKGACTVIITKNTQVVAIFNKMPGKVKNLRIAGCENNILAMKAEE